MEFSPQAMIVEQRAEPVSKPPINASPRVRGAFQTVRPTQVFSGPSEDSAFITDIGEGTKVNVVDSEGRLARDSFQARATTRFHTPRRGRKNRLELMRMVYSASNYLQRLHDLIANSSKSNDERKTSGHARIDLNSPSTQSCGSSLDILWELQREFMISCQL